MADQSPSEFQVSKNHLLAPEAQKRKKSSKKKANEKTSGAYADSVEPHAKGVLTEANFDLLHYTNKLEYELATARKQLKSQRKKFRQIIHGLAQHFDSKGVTAQALEECIKNLGPVNNRNEELDSYYEKFFTVNKYQIVEDPITHQAQPVPVENHVENQSKQVLNHLDAIPKLNLKAPGKYSQEEVEKDDKKKGRKSSKTNAVEGTNGDEAPKKRKYTKKTKPNEEEQKNQAPESEDIQEIPPFVAKDLPKKSEGKGQKSEEAQKNYGDLTVAPKMYEDPRYMGIGGYRVSDIMPGLTQPMAFDQNALMSQYFSTPMNFQLPDGGESYNKLLQDILKSSMNPSMMNMAPDKTKEMMSYLQQAGFK